MGKELPAIHGTDHLPWGPDAIPGIALLTDIPSPPAAMEWALLLGNTTYNLTAGRNELLWNSGIVASSGSGWALGNENTTDDRIEVGDAGRYLVICNGDFNNNASSAKTIYIQENPFYYNGSWVVDAGLCNVPFRYGLGQPFPVAGALSITNIAVYNFGVIGATNGAVVFEFDEDDTGNAVTWGGHIALLLRLR